MLVAATSSRSFMRPRNSFTLAASSSTLLSFAIASSNTRLACRRSSTDVNEFLSSAMCDSAFATLDWNLTSTWVNTGESDFPFASRCFAVMNLFTPSRALVAVFSVARACLASLVISGLDRRVRAELSRKIMASPSTRLACSSASPTWRSMSRSSAACFSSRILFSRSAMRPPAASSCSWKLFSCALASRPRELEKRFTSRSFAWMEIRAMEDRDCADAAAASRARAAARASSDFASSNWGRPSSISPVRMIASMTDFTFSPASRSSEAQTMPSSASLQEARSCTRRSRQASSCGPNFATSSRTTPWASPFRFSRPACAAW
mmetsp:Transcript_59773/g.168442  ORF Transcript_59773/g.168442 Transcript_59773/m.168442 type:complete len:321 (-) Transcript_59773:885-1847(-)